MIRSPLFLSIAALWLLLGVAEWMRPCFFLHDDNATSFVGMYMHDFRVLTETGRVAEVNFYQYGGEPFLEQGQTAVLYPPVYFGGALAKWISGDPRWAIEWLAAGHLTFGLIGFYFWLRRGGVDAWLAALGGLAWVLCPFVMIFASNWITATYVAAWLPWLFWALDRLFARPTILSAIFLGTFLGLFFLQGYVQWVVYSVLFLGLYALLKFWDRTIPRKAAIIYHLFLAALIFLVFALPLLLPMFHASENSAARGHGISLLQALFYRVELVDLLRAQFGFFRPNLIFGGSTAILFAPALLLLPLSIWSFFKGSPELCHRIFPLLVLSVAALFFSSQWHYILSQLPVLEKFRWPLKVFIFADFFLIAALVWSVSAWKSKWLARACVAFVLASGATVSFACHDSNFFSSMTLPSSKIPQPRGIDTASWRRVTVGNSLYPASFAHGESTFFAVPSLGGYNLLASPETLDFALGLNIPSLLREPITPEWRKKLQARGVRYWVVEAEDSAKWIQLGTAPAGIREVEQTGRLLSIPLDRRIYEDLAAVPIVFATDAPTVSRPFRYLGNSMLIPVDNLSSPLEISLGPTDGWWYRVDGGPWLKPVYGDGRVRIDLGPPAHFVEVTYFDSRFRRGLLLSLYVFVFLIVIVGIQLRFWRIRT